MIVQDTIEKINNSKRTPLATRVERVTISRILNGSAELATSGMGDVPKEGQWQENER